MKVDKLLKYACLLIHLCTWRRMYVSCTIDVNLPELQYLSDHMEPEECWRLVASLHFHSYDLPPNVEEAELRLAKDTPCIRLLLHWNSTPGEGKGETHEILGRRLRQLGRQDLADWLGRTVFHELGKDIERSLDSPFKSFLTTAAPKAGYGPQLVQDEKPVIPNFDWLPIDTISFTIVVLLLCVIIGLVCASLFKRFVRNRKKKRRSKSGSRSKYSPLESDEECSCSSETESDKDEHVQYGPTI